MRTLLLDLHDAVLEQQGLVAHRAVVRRHSGLQVDLHVAALGGALHVANRPGGGARVVAELPLPQAYAR